MAKISAAQLEELQRQLQTLQATVASRDEALSKERSERERLVSEFDARMYDKDRAMEAEMLVKFAELARMEERMKRREAEHEEELRRISSAIGTATPNVPVAPLVSDASSVTQTAPVAPSAPVDTGATLTAPVTPAARVEPSTQCASVVSPTPVAPAAAPPSPATTTTAMYGLKIPIYKSGGDAESFINRFEQYCRTQHVEDARKANLILTAVDDVTFTVLNRELTEEEKGDYNKVKLHLLKRFDVVKEKGQRRLILRQAKRKPGQDLSSFYTDLLGLAEKAYPGERSGVVDEAIIDQLSDVRMKKLGCIC